ncbi:MAG: hypothetical protein IT256_07990 [Chitinophagaceae bacterium]|nr:hypothetical protein [Chitinophagaceae bacterium]
MAKLIAFATAKRAPYHSSSTTATTPKLKEADESNVHLAFIRFFFI